MQNKNKVFDNLYYFCLLLVSVALSFGAIYFLFKSVNSNNDDKLQNDFLIVDKCANEPNESAPLQLYDYFSNIQQISCRFDNTNEYIISGYVASPNVTKITLSSLGYNIYYLDVYYDNTTYQMSFDFEPLNWRNYLEGWSLSVGQYTRDYYTRALDYIRDDIYELQENNFQVQLYHIDGLNLNRVKGELSIQTDYIFNNHFDLRFSSLLEMEYDIWYNNTDIGTGVRTTSMLVKNSTLSSSSNNDIFRTLYIYQSATSFVDTFTFVVLDTMPYYSDLISFHNWTLTQYNELVNNAYLEGYYKGQNDAFQNSQFTQSGFKLLVNTILSYPINMVKNSLDFEFMGVNISKIVIFLISGSIVIFAIKRFTH